MSIQGGIAASRTIRASFYPVKKLGQCTSTHDGFLIYLRLF